MSQNTPRIDQHLPEFMGFVHQLAVAYRHDELRTWKDVAISTRAFFTPDRLKDMDAIIPGWKNMSSYANGETAIHIVCVFITLLSSPEYAKATDSDKAIMEWSALLHDIAKQTNKFQSDSTHAFRSAAEAASILSNLGFGVQIDDPLFIQNWITTTTNAHISQNGVVIPDNSRLTEIISGIEAIFGGGQPGSLILKIVLFHMSLEAEKDWPCAAPLTPDEIQQYLDSQLIRLLSAQMLADSASYNLFDHATRERYRAEILESLIQVNQIIQSNPCN